MCAAPRDWKKHAWGHLHCGSLSRPKQELATTGSPNPPRIYFNMMVVVYWKAKQFRNRPGQRFYFEPTIIKSLLELPRWSPRKKWAVLIDNFKAAGGLGQRDKHHWWKCEPQRNGMWLPGLLFQGRKRGEWRCISTALSVIHTRLRTATPTRKTDILLTLTTEARVKQPPYTKSLICTFFLIQDNSMLYSQRITHGLRFQGMI